MWTADTSGDGVSTNGAWAVCGRMVKTSLEKSRKVEKSREKSRKVEKL